jgi:hypothetical protein
VSNDPEHHENEDAAGAQEADHFTDGGERDDELVEEVVVPSWQISGLNAYLRSVVDPIFKQLDAFNRIAEAAAAALPKYELPRIDIPKLHLSPELFRSLANFEDALAPMREAVASMVDWSRLVESVIDPAIFERVRELVARRMPPNWSEVEDWRRGTTFVEESGWGIVWLPRSEVVSALLDAGPDDRDSVLVENGPTLVEDALECAKAIQHPELRFLGECVAEIAESIREGRHRAAQALAASVLTELIQGILGHKRLAEVHIEYGQSWEDQSIQLLRFALITSTIPKALSNFYRDKGDPMPSLFNRHAVAHGASPVQFTELNALVGLLLVTALTRELQELYDEGLLPDE